MSGNMNENSGWICKISQYINDNPRQYGQVKIMKTPHPPTCAGWVM